MNKQHGPVINITHEEGRLLECAMSNMDIVLRNGEAVNIVNKLNMMYALLVTAMNGCTRISHALNIDDKETIGKISLGIQRAIYENIIHEGTKEEIEETEEDSGNVKGEGGSMEHVETKDTEQKEQSSNVIEFKKRK